MQGFNQSNIRNELLIYAKAVGIPTGAAEDFIDRSITAAIKSLSHRSIITENDLRRAIAKELKKYDPYLAYVYQNRDIII